MDVIRMAARGSRARTFDRRRWADSAETLATRTPVPGSRTVGALKRRHFTQGLAHDPDPGFEHVSTTERAALAAMLESRKEQPRRARPQDVPTAADLPLPPEGATRAEIDAWRDETYMRMRQERAAALANTTNEYKSTVGEGVKLRRTAAGLEVVAD